MLLAVLLACVPAPPSEKEPPVGRDSSVEPPTGDSQDSGDPGDSTPEDTAETGETAETAPLPDTDGDGWTEAEDCDDADASVHPDAVDACGDGVDADCDGADDSCGPSGEGPISAFATATLTGVDASNWAGFAASGAGDLDGDGFADLAIGAYRALPALGGLGAVYIVNGPVSGDRSLADATATLADPVGGAMFPDELAGLGDVDGDGLDELAVGAHRTTLDGEDFSGVVYVVGGGLSGDVSLPLVAEASLAGAEGEAAGWSVAGAGDVDGDGVGDVLVGAPEWETGGTSPGAAYVVSGPLAGRVALADTPRLRGEGDHHYAGYTVVGPGDVDGDGLADVVVTAYGWDGATGAAYVVVSPVEPELSLSDADAVIAGPYEQARYGAAAAGPGDVDGDGLADLVVGAKWDDRGGALAGAAFLSLAPFSGAISCEGAAAILVGDAANDLAGFDVAAPGDVDLDGTPELWIGAHWHDGGGRGNAGAAYLVDGAVRGTLLLSDAARWKVWPDESGDYFGTVLAPAGDTDGDGAPDLLAGNSSDDTSGLHAGAAFLFSGGR